MSTEAIKELREMTGAGLMSCKKALEECNGDIHGALDILRQQGIAKAKKKEHRDAREGLVETYVHFGGRIGALVEVNCETDFVAHTDDFKELAHALAMQVAATAPRFVSVEDMPEDIDPNETDPKEACLLCQPYIRDGEKTVRDLITDTVAKVGENIKVRRFARFQLGKD